jgi:hypothetical protein
VYNYGNIYGGTWAGTLDNNSGGNIYTGTLVTGWFLNEGGTVYGGTFTQYGNQNYSDIYGGTFTGPNFINISSYGSGSIHGGIFTGINFHNYDGPATGSITGGTFEITGFDNGTGTIDFANISVTSGGDQYTGNWLGQYWNNGIWFAIGDLYFTNTSGDFFWDNLQNWNTAADNSGTNPKTVPWTDVTSSYTNLYLIDTVNIPNLNRILIGGNGVDWRIHAKCDTIIAKRIIENGESIIASLNLPN